MKTLAVLVAVFATALLASCNDYSDSPLGSDLSPRLAKGGGNPGKPGAGDGGTTATVALSGGYATTADQVVEEKKTGKGISFRAGTENMIEYSLDLPAYGGDAVCVGGGTAVGNEQAFWNAFVAEQNVVTTRAFLFNYRTDAKVAENRTEVAWPHPDGSFRIMKAGTTNDLGLDVNATVEHTVDVDGNDVYTLTGGSLQFRYLSGEVVTCPNTGTFVLTAKR